MPCAHTASETLLDHCLCKRHWTGVPGPIPRDLESQGPRRRDCRSPALASSIDVPLLWMASFIVSRKQALNTYAEWKRNALCRCGFSQSAWFSVAESEMKRDLCLLHPLPKKKKKSHIRHAWKCQAQAATYTWAVCTFSGVLLHDAPISQSWKVQTKPWALSGPLPAPTLGRMRSRRGPSAFWSTAG